MSLQPLDTTTDIPEAYKLALSESRRWLVLSYVSRSALALKAQGIGLPELRKQLEEEEEVLFGFLRFRRRGIVLQYTNPDCSRVVKARAQVHLQTILNFFRDNDFLLETSTPTDITLDNIARLTNATSTSTVSSNKRSKRLTDIMEESPFAAGEYEDGESSPASIDTQSVTSTAKPSEDTDPSGSTPPKALNDRPTNKLLLKPFGHENSPISPPTTPRSPLPPSPLCRTPSPSEQSTSHASTEKQRDSYDSTTSNSIPSEHTSSGQEIASPSPTPPPVILPPTPSTPTAPEKLRLLKALEIRRQKLNGVPIVSLKKPEPSSRPAQNEANGIQPPQTEPPPTKPATPEHKSRLLEAKKAALEAKLAALEEYRRHISTLEQSGRDLLSGWVNFQSSTSLLWRRKFIRITCAREVILSETEDAAVQHGGDKLLRWKVREDINSVEIPERDEEQLPHSLRVNVERGGATFSVACQSASDLTNLRRVLGYCLNDERLFTC